MLQLERTGTMRGSLKKRFGPVGVLLGLVLSFAPTAFARAGGMPGEDFRPGWTGTLCLDGSSQGHGQTTGGLSFSASYQFTEEGTSLSLGLHSQTLKVEEVQVGQGGLSVNGSLAAGDFTPSLGLSSTRSASDMVARSASLSLDWTLGDSWGLSVGGSFSRETHRGPLSLLLDLPEIELLEMEAEIVSHSTGLDLGLQHDLKDWWSLSLGASRSWDVTDEVRNMARTVGTKLNQRGWTQTGTLGTGFDLGKRWGLDLGGSFGRQYSPGNGFYNPRTGSTVKTASAETFDFFAVNWALVFSFGL
jgi:hypothetical protein